MHTSTTTLVWVNPTFMYLLTTVEDKVYTTADGYDAAGNRTSETYGLVDTSVATQYNYPQYPTTTVVTASYENATAAYDADNRMTALSDTGLGGTAPISISWEYDKAGNIRHMLSTYRALDAQGNVAASNSTEDYWYKYDALNRFTVTKGVFTGTRGSGSIAAGSTGSALTYNADGTRATMTDATSSEVYSYTADGYLAQTAIGGVIRAKFVYDAMGRVTGYSEYNAAGSSVVYSRTAVYDAASLVASDVVTTVRTDGTYVASTAYDYKLLSGSTYTGAYDGGAVTHSRTTTTKNAAAQPTSDTVNSFVWWDTAQQAGITYTPNISSPSTTNTTTYNYDITGALSTVSIYDGRPRTVTFVNNSSGEVMSRDEADANTATGDPHERRYYFAGLAVGDVSNNGTSDTDYAVSIATHTTVPGTGAFRNGSTTSVSYADFDQSYNPINGGNYASASTHYTVAAGDTLASIAQTVWGDSSLWYVIADANGLSLDDSLSAGQTLSIPNKVEDLHNNAQTFKVYDPNAAIGSTFPNVPKPQHNNGCGVFGQILLAVVAVAVSFLTYGALAGPLTTALGSETAGAVAAGVVAGAAGSIVSQTIGLATGLQKSFNWGNVALAAIGGAVGGGLSGSFGSLGQIGGAIARGVVGSVITQGIGVATGLQKSFDWAGVAAAGIGAGVASYASEELPGAAIGTPGQPGYQPPTLGNSFVSGMAGNIANAATRTLINGSDFGDNLIAALPDTIGQTIGSLIGSALSDGASSQIDVAQVGKTSSDDLITQIQQNAASNLAAFSQHLDQEIANTPVDLSGLQVGVPNIEIADGAQGTQDDSTSYGHRLSGGYPNHGMSADDREAAFENQMTQLGATKSGDAYLLNGDTVTFDNQYLADKPMFKPDGGSYFDPSTAVYKDSRAALDTFLDTHPDYGEVGALSGRGSDKTVMYAGSIDTGTTGGTVLISYFDLQGNQETFHLPMAENFVENVYHEIGHAVFGYASEADADSFALGRMGLANTLQSWVKVPVQTPFNLIPVVPKLNIKSTK